MWTKMEEEIEIHRTLKEHPHIVRFERTFKDHENVYILMEKCNQKVWNWKLNKKQELL